MPDLDLTDAHMRVRVPTVTATTVRLPSIPGVVVLPVAGPRGPSGGVFTFHQDTPSASWLIPHGLGCRPPVAVYLDDDPTEVVWPDVTYVDANTIVISLPAAASGGATI